MGGRPKFYQHISPTTYYLHRNIFCCRCFYQPRPIYIVRRCFFFVSPASHPKCATIPPVGFKSTNSSEGVGFCRNKICIQKIENTNSTYCRENRENTSQLFGAKKHVQKKVYIYNIYTYVYIYIIYIYVYIIYICIYIYLYQVVLQSWKQNHFFLPFQSCLCSTTRLIFGKKTRLLGAAEGLGSFPPLCL